MHCFWVVVVVVAAAIFGAASLQVKERNGAVEVARQQVPLLRTFESRQVTGPRWWRLPCSSSERDGPRCRMRFSRMSAATRRDATGPPRSARSCHMARIQDKLQGTY